jgi:hypothetical protein
MFFLKIPGYPVLHVLATSTLHNYFFLSICSHVHWGGGLFLTVATRNLHVQVLYHMYISCTVLYLYD